MSSWLALRWISQNLTNQYARYWPTYHCDFNSRGVKFCISNPLEFTYTTAINKAISEAEMPSILMALFSDREIICLQWSFTLLRIPLTYLLQWVYNEFQWCQKRAFVSQITHNWTICSKAYSGWQQGKYQSSMSLHPDSKVHGANMGPTWVLSVPDGPMLAPWTLLSGWPFARRNYQWLVDSAHTRATDATWHANNWEYHWPNFHIVSN